MYRHSLDAVLKGNNDSQFLGSDSAEIGENLTRLGLLRDLSYLLFLVTVYVFLFQVSDLSIQI